MTKENSKTRGLPPADPRLAFWGVILVALGLWIGIKQCCPGDVERADHTRQSEAAK